MRRTIGWQVVFVLLIPGWVAAEAPIEELPPPTTKSVLAKESPAASELPQPGWELYGVNGRHYFIGRLAMADYLRAGQRHIVTLIEEDPASHSQPDPNYLYYREEATGHRWAIGRQAAVDRRYSVYFQPADAPGAWVLFQRALGSWDDLPALNDVESLFIAEPACGYSHTDSGTQFYLH